MDTLQDATASRRRLPKGRVLRALRSCLVLLLPVVFTGAIATLLSYLPYDALFPGSTAATAFGALASLIARGSNGIIALCLLVLISLSLAVEVRNRQIVEISPRVAALLALVNFFVVMRLPDSDPTLWQLGTRSALPAIIVAVAGTELFVFFSRLRALRFGRSAYDLDPNLHLALTAIAPAFATVAVFALLGRGMALLSFDPSLWIARGLTTLDGALGSALPGLLVLGVINQLLWFVGLHGPHLLENVIEIRFADSDPLQLFEFSKRFLDIYVHIGGSGSTLGLLFALLILARRGEGTRVARYALLPALFNINEVVLFGLPVIFNPRYLIPFVLAPLVQIVVAYLAVHSGWVVLDATLVPWMTPPIVAGTINSGSWHGGALQAVCATLSTLIYAPFVAAAARHDIDAGRASIARTVAQIERLKLQHADVLERGDEIGLAARKLLGDFIEDFGSERVYLAYQPQHDRTARLVGFEALLRWRHPRFGPISPAVVCALLEEAQRIDALGRWAIACACEQLQTWKQSATGPLRVSINVSPIQLRDTGLVAYVAATLARYGLQANEVGLELTESQHVPDDAHSIQTLKGLEELGVHLEMDDFGMGYSSMLYIRRFRFAAIKLDGVLTRDVLHDRNCREIIATVIRLGEAAGLRIVAEFVETAEQQRVLADLGCDEFQGYLYSRPLPAPECLDYLRSHAPAAAAERAA